MEQAHLLSVRAERVEDHEAIRQVNRLAFHQDDEARLVDMLRETGHVKVSLVAVKDDRVVGHVLFSDLPIETDTGIVGAVALAPLAVVPQCQRMGIGSGLVRKGLQACRRMGERIAIVLGRPAYYRRFGFSTELAKPLDAPFSGEAFMALELSPGALHGLVGTVRYPAPFRSG